MKLATKYQINSLRSRISGILHDSWPQIFEQWLRLRSETEIMRSTHQGYAGHFMDGKFLDDRLPEPVSAVRFARHFDVPSILPYAYYAHAGRGCTDEWHTSHSDPIQRRALETTLFRTARWTLLQTFDFQIVSTLREHLTEDVVSIVDLLMKLGSLERSSVNHREPFMHVNRPAYAHFLHHRYVEKSRFVSASRAPDPLYTLQKLYNKCPSWSICDGCSLNLQDVLQSRQEAIWETLAGLVQSIDRDIRGTLCKLITSLHLLTLHRDLVACEHKFNNLIRVGGNTPLLRRVRSFAAAVLACLGTRS